MKNIKKTNITVALPKGRLADKAIAILEKCGLDCSTLKIYTRQLILQDGKKSMNFIFVKPSDVPTYVERGSADFGFVGKDTLLEENKDIYEPVDLKMGACYMAVAGYPNFNYEKLAHKLCVATKYVRIAKEYFNKKGIDVDIIKLNGSVELGPLIGLSDVIVDLVESGKTLEANGLVPLEKICEITARMIVNKVSLKTKGEVLTPLIAQIKSVVNEGGKK